MRNPYISLAAAGVVGVVAFAWCTGFHIVNPQFLDWIFNGGMDPSFNFIGWHMFRSAPWEIPFGATHAMGYPVGTSVALTDSIPLVAILFKTIRELLPPNFQYLGLWLLSCFVLQGVFGALLVATATPRRSLQLLGATLFVLSPVLTHRLGHAALSAHWLLLAALWLNRRGRNRASGRDLPSWALLTAVVAGTHPYLTIMVLPLAFATFAARPDKPARILTDAVGPSAVIIAVAGAMWWACGYFIVPDSSALVNSGFGLLSMNILSPLIPPPGALTYGHINLSLARADQHEGFSYLGLGAMFLTVVAVLFMRPRASWMRSKADVVLGLACVALTLLALSPIVTFGTKTILEYPAHWWGPLATFRASGRMFWPVYYAWLFGVTSVVVRRLPLKLALAVMVCAVGLQAADTEGVYRLRRMDFAKPLAEPLPSDFWKAVPRHYQHIVLDPSNMCAPPDKSLDYRFFALHAGYVGATINGGYAARYDIDSIVRYCQKFAADIQSGTVSDDTLYIVGPGMEPLFRSAQMPVACIRVDGFGVCFTRRSYDAWKTEFDVNSRWLPPLSEFRRFRETLEAYYRDRLARPTQDLPGTVDSRLAAVTRFLGYRVGGCDVEEALSFVFNTQAGTLCRHQTVEPQPVPPASELRELYSTFGAQRQSDALAATHVDAEGEMVWVQAYADRRQHGQSPDQATTTIIESIREITQR